MLKAAWILAHDKRRFLNFKVDLGCPLDSCLSELSSDKDRLTYSQWLVATSPDGGKYNIHAVWIWYYEHKFGTVLSPGKSS